MDNHLYVNGWNLQNDYEKIINGDRYKEYIDIQVMFIGDKPIGCALIAVNRQISIYMSDKYRGRGRNYASLLINFILRKNCLKNTFACRFSIFRNIVLRSGEEFLNSSRRIE